MKIAFVGKGGSGKSTLTALFIRYLQSKGLNLIAIDADLNMNLAGLLGVHSPRETFLSAPDVAASIRTHLKGSNNRISDIKKFLPTTPPGAGSNLITQHNDPVIESCSVKLDERSRLLTVGTYEGSDIGQTCYHSHLFVAENLISHMQCREFDLVCDMVAGTDAFAYSMYLQFDCIVLLTEPTPESVEVSRLYLSLARSAGIESIVQLVANKIEDDSDLYFVTERIGIPALGCIRFIPELKKLRQSDQAITLEHLNSELLGLMSLIYRQAINPPISPRQRYFMMHKLHEQLNNKEWVRLGYGDVMNQIDREFLSTDVVI